MDCPVCYFPYSLLTAIPKILPRCGHPVCQSCVVKLMEDNTLTCPFCKEIYTNPNTLPNNYSILNILIEKDKELNNTEKEIMNKNKMEKKMQGNCEKHPSKIVDFYCKSDNLFFCNRCVFEHTDHEIFFLDEYSAKVKEQTSEETKIIEEYLHNIEKLKNKYMNLMKDYQDYNKNWVMKAEQYFSYALKKIKEKKEKIINDFHENVETQEKWMKKGIKITSDAHSKINELFQKIKVQKSELNLISNMEIFNKGIEKFSKMEEINKVKEQFNEFFFENVKFLTNF